MRITLDRETEAELHRAALAGNAAAKARLLSAHLRHVESIARKYKHYHIQFDELVAEGNLGLVMALDKFEPERGFRFITYAAFWIRARISFCILRNWTLVGGGRGSLRSKDFFRLRRERSKLLTKLGSHELVVDALADQMGKPRESIVRMLQHIDSVDVSLDGPCVNFPAETFGDRFAVDAPNPEEQLALDNGSKRSRALVGCALQVLDDRERMIVKSRFMVDDDDQMSLNALGERLGVSRERVRQLETRAKRKLAKAIAAQEARL